MEKNDAIIADIEKKTEQLMLDFAMKKSIKEKLEKDLLAKECELKKIGEYIEILEQVRILLQRASEYAQKIRQQIEILVTHCLQFVFGSNIEFCIEINSKAKRSRIFVLSTYDGFKIRQAARCKGRRSR